MNDKKCKDCGKVKSLTEFYKCVQNNSYYFYQSYCKDCDKKRSRAWYKNHLEEGRRKRAEWQINNMETHIRNIKAYKDRHPEKIHAHILARKIKHLTFCEKCGAGGKIYKHHPDYSKPKIIKSLCLDCHKKEHNRLVEIF